MEFISQILGFMTILLQLIDEVVRLVHLHALHTFSCKVHHEPDDLCGAVLPYDLASYELASEAHYAILYRGYLVTSLSFLYFSIRFLDVLHEGMQSEAFPR
jgi:hypothetical protein